MAIAAPANYPRSMGCIARIIAAVCIPNGKVKGMQRSSIVHRIVSYCKAQCKCFPPARKTLPCGVVGFPEIVGILYIACCIQKTQRPAMPNPLSHSTEHFIYCMLYPEEGTTCSPLREKRCPVTFSVSPKSAVLGILYISYCIPYT